MTQPPDEGFTPFAGGDPDPVPYDPRRDACFASDVLDIVVQAHGEWCHPGRVVLERRGGACDCAYLAQCTGEAIGKGRRVGLRIEGSKRLGYRLVGFRYVRYVRPEAVLAWPPAGLPEKLTMAEVG